MNARTTPAVVLGATGYVGGEILRLLAGHPRFRLRAACSRGDAGTAIGEVFPHLATSYPATVFAAPDSAMEIAGDAHELAVFSAAPHGASAQMLDAVIGAAETANRRIHVVDASADFRFADRQSFESVYGVEHGAPHRLPEFTAALPEQLADCPTKHIGNPGCFASALLLASVPLLKSGLIEPTLYATGITGSTGSGKTPLATTHHPVRHNNLYTYKALAHRHVPEVAALAENASGVAASFRFVPHSGPFARGIHMTVQAQLQSTVSRRALLDLFREYYRNAPFVRITADSPRVKDVAGSNYAHLSVASDADSVAVFCALDNLIKGAAGSAMQWMNRLFDEEETAGLAAPAPGWI